MAPSAMVNYLFAAVSLRQTIYIKPLCHFGKIWKTTRATCSQYRGRSSALQKRTATMHSRRLSMHHWAKLTRACVLGWISRVVQNDGGLAELTQRADGKIEERQSSTKWSTSWVRNCRDHRVIEAYVGGVQRESEGQMWPSYDEAWKWVAIGDDRAA